MTTLQILFFVAAVAGLILVWLGSSGERQGKEPPFVAQVGYLAVIVGAFGLMAQFMSFAAVMLVFLLVAGSLMLIDHILLRKKRAADEQRHDAVEYAYSFFPIILVVFLLRSFLAEPFQIPSSSMRPGLIPGDFILVSKFSYGVRLPIVNKVVIPVGTPQRGDVMVFEFPLDRSTNYIKRVIGVPGDVVEYRDKVLTLNGVVQPQTMLDAETYNSDDANVPGNPEPVRSAQRYTEVLDGHTHDIFVEPQKPSISPPDAEKYRLMGAMNFPENCQYDMQDGRWFKCVVPSGHYFMLGDNRDNSGDGRYWGFVPDNHIVGKAFFVWLNFSDFSRVGTRVQ